MRIIISSNPQNLTTALSAYTSTATVEAEYGDTVIEGSVLTLAHHGARASRPCPCSIGNMPQNLGVEVVGISHVDLDTLGGVMAVMGRKPSGYENDNYQGGVEVFWKSAAFVDTNGVHKLHLCEEVQYEVGGGFKKGIRVLDLLNAWWAFSESEGRVYPPRDGSAVEVDLSRHFAVIDTLLLGGEEFEALLQAGREWAAAKAALEAASYAGTAGADVLVRSAESFVNHLYAHEGVAAKAVVGFNSKTGAITVSLADPIEGVSCKDFVQSVWGPEAGGHAGIAGSPRNRALTIEDAKEVALKLATLIG